MNNKGLCFYLRVTVSWWHLQTTTAWTEVNLKCGGVVEHKVFSVFSMIYDVAWKEIPLHPVLQLVRVNWISLYLIQVLTGRTTTLYIDPDPDQQQQLQPQTKENSFSIPRLPGWNRCKNTVLTCLKIKPVSTSYRRVPGLLDEVFQGRVIFLTGEKSIYTHTIRMEANKIIKTTLTNDHTVVVAGSSFSQRQKRQHISFVLLVLLRTYISPYLRW